MDWKPFDSEPIDAKAAEALQGGLHCSELFARALIRRGVRTVSEANVFLHPASQPLPDPTLLWDMERAAAVIRRAIADGKRICIYGDYDVDGVSATTILYRTLRSLGATVSYYIPMRAGEGYGMHAESIRKLAAAGEQLLITVDNGISAHEEVRLSKSLGMEVVVTDHHRCHNTLPDAAAVVCASRPGQPAGIADLCGASVAMLLATQLGMPAESFLALAALATVADVMPLTGFNRGIVTRGMRLLQTEPGLMALLEAAGGGDRPADETTLGFLLAPRLNAAGRMGDARRAVELLLAEEDGARRALAAELENANTARRAEEQRILKEAEAQIDPTVHHLVLMLRGEDWNPGVIGIVAARLTEKYGCPTMLFTREGTELVGSGRSVPKIDLFELLTRHAAYFTRFGGHAGAAGAAMEEASFEECRAAIERDLNERFPLGLLREPIVYEDAVLISDCTESFCNELEQLAPFGEGNREPLFRIKGLLSDLMPMGRDNAHLSANLSAPEGRMRLVAFRMGDRLMDWQYLKKVEALCLLRKNTFRGRTSVNAYVTDLHASVSDWALTTARWMLQYPEEGAHIRIKLATTARPSEEEMRHIFIRLRGRLQTGIRIEELYEPELITMMVLHEAGVVDEWEGVFYERVFSGKKDISKGRLYSILYV
ncbi:MAG: single-stranded-DNA-specific exonuclease RecJ [Clostridia bacterium]|nr:single-stranded-DNA-specific exonuclease RecJ [Clostridia bacterium]